MTLFRKPLKPFILGDLRLKSWRTLDPHVSDNDPTWQARCAQFWTLQGRLYGVVFSPFVFLVDNTEGVVSTYATVLEVLPGERTADHSRVPIASAEVASLRQ